MRPERPPGLTVLRLAREGSFLASSEVEEKTLRALLGAHRDQERGGRHLKKNRGTVVTRVPLGRRPDGAASGLDAAVKEVSLPRRRRIYHGLGGSSPFAGEFAKVEALRARGILAPRPFAASLRPRGGSEFLITEFIAGAASLRELAWQGPAVIAERPVVQRLFSLLGAWLRHLHERGVWQRDMKPSNVLVRGGEGPRPEFFLIDVTRIRLLAGPLDEERRARNLGQVLDLPRELDDAAAESLLAGYSRSAEEAASRAPRVRAVLAERREERRRTAGFTYVDEELRGHAG